MADTVKTLVGNWTVRFLKFRWTYTFFENGSVHWRDPNTRETGKGTWALKDAAIRIAWTGSRTVENWSLPITPQRQGGQITAGYGKGSFIADKDAPNFDAFAPEGQVDAFACWAASLAWFSKVSPSIATSTQLSIMAKSNTDAWTTQGAITLNGLMTVNLPDGSLRRKRVSAASLAAHVKAGVFPLLVAFRTGPLGGHCNVIHAYSAGNGHVRAMEPWFPDPVTDPQYRPVTENGLLTRFEHRKTGAAFKFAGAHVSRPLDFYLKRPLGAEFVIAFEESKNIHP